MTRNAASAETLPASWLAHRYDPGHDAVHFVETPRAVRRDVPFLTDDYLTVDQPLVVARREAITVAGHRSALHFIFHSAYCCSTLLANALDLDGVATTFKEPVILNDLVGWRHRGATPAAVGAVLDDALTVLARPFGDGEASIIKPSNLVNGLAATMLALRPEARCILLHAPLEIFLGSIAGKGMWGRLWVRDLLAKQLKDGIVDLGMSADDIFLQTDLQVAAVGWLVQQQLFATLAARWPARVRTLDSETLLARPAESIAALGQLFELGLPDGAADAIAHGEAFARNAKDGKSYSRADRLTAQRNAAHVHAEEIDRILIWARAVANAAGIPLTLPRPLLPK
jgi:hypothetical protein